MTIIIKYVLLFKEGEKMKLATDINDRIKLEETQIKAKRLCLLYKCTLIDLMVLSIKVQAERTKEQNKNQI